MELQAVLEALEALPGNRPTEVVTDSAYVSNCFRDRWWVVWQKRGWRTSDRKPVANQDLWKPLIEHYQQRSVTFRHVKGHSGNCWNDRADQLATAAADNRHGSISRDG